MDSEKIALEKKQIVFVTGLHRSGTSLLHRCLRDHPHASGFRDTGVPEDEGQHLQTVVPAARQFGGPGRFGFEPGAYLDENNALATSENAERLWREWSRYWDLTKPLLLEKSPTTLIRTRYFQALFPEARFVVVLRHPLPVTYATYKWKGWTFGKRDGLSIGQLLTHWLLVHEKFARDLPHLKRAKVILYEELVQRPDEIFADLFRFLDLPSFETQQEIRPAINQKYFQRWEAMRRHPIKSFYARHLIRQFESRVNRFGYSLDDPDLTLLPAEFTDR